MVYTLTQEVKTKNDTIRDYSFKDRKNVKELMKFEFEGIAFLAIIIGLSQVNFSELHISALTPLIMGGIYYVVFVSFFVVPLLLDYIAERKKISEVRVDLGYKLIFLQIIITIGLLPMLIRTLPIWGNIVTIIVEGLVLILSLIFLLKNWNKKRQILKKKKA